MEREERKTGREAGNERAGGMEIAREGEGAMNGSWVWHSACKGRGVIVSIAPQD